MLGIFTNTLNEHMTVHETDNNTYELELYRVREGYEHRYITIDTVQDLCDNIECYCDIHASEVMDVINDVLFKYDANQDTLIW